MQPLLVLAAEHASEHGGSKAAFYIAGLVLAGVAVLIGALGVARPAFAQGAGTGRAVIGVTALLAAATLVAAVATA